MAKVIVFGSLNMDLSIACEKMPRAGETISGSAFLVNPGGKGANQALAAARLGADVHMVGAVGDDAFGSQLAAGLADAGVDCAHLTVAAGRTTGVAVIVRSAGDNRIVLDPGANHALSAAAVSHALEELAVPGDIFLTQLECDLSATLAALACARRLGMQTVFNPAPARILPPETWANVDVVCLNETECDLITGILPEDDASARRAMDRLRGWGVGVVALTLGAKGSLVASDEGVIEAVPPAVEVVDTTGAGDTYIGALLRGMAAGQSLAETIWWATAASALATTRLGAQQSVPTVAEILGTSPKITCIG